MYFISKQSVAAAAAEMDSSRQRQLTVYVTYFLQFHTDLEACVGYWYIMITGVRQQVQWLHIYVYQK